MRRVSALPRRKLRSSVVAVLGQDRFGMELHAFDRQRLVAHAHDLVDRRPRSVHAVTSRQSGSDALLDRPASGSASPRTDSAGRANTPLPSWWIVRGLAVHDLPARARPCRRTPGRCLVAEAHAEDRHVARRAARSPRSETPASFGVHGPGEITMRVGLERCDLVERDLVVADARARPRPARRSTARGCR